jgi:ankyrin repeat protein
MSTVAQDKSAELPMINGIQLGPRIEDLIQGDGPEAALFRASVYGDSQRVRDLLSADSRLVNLVRDGPNRRPYWTPMLLACRYGQRGVMEVLFDHGASLDWRGHGETLLHCAAADSHAAVVEFLIQRGADVNVFATLGGTARITPLLKNVLQEDGGDEQVVRLLLQAGADPEIRIGDWSALSQAAGAGNIPVVKVLLEFGADVNTRTPDFSSSWGQPYYDLWPIVEPEWRDTRPLYGAVCTGSIELVNLLLDRGADINALSYGWTALQAAAGQGNCQMAELLLARGADIGAKSSNGKTAIELLFGHKRSTELLREAMDRKRANASR